MLPANLINALQVLSRATKPLIEVSSDTTKPAIKLEPGQQLQGAVQSQVSEGLFKVQVAGQTLQMRLPGDTKSGDILSLQVVATSPRLTFSIAASADPISTPEEIGSTARLLSNLTQLPQEKAVVQQAGSHAVWQTEGQAPAPKQLAGGLRDALANSGLFYESHQAQWVRGERSTAQLLVEPQNQLPDKLLPSPSPSDTAPQPSKSAQESSLPVAKELLPLVQQQLHTMETHQLTWIGQVWPGQEMQWEIQGEPEERTHQQEDRKWSTEMELALPKLGDVHARLVFSQNGVQLTLHAADSATVELFSRNLPRLKAALGDNNIPLSATIVEKV